MASYFSNSSCEGDVFMTSFPRDQKLASHSEASSHAANILMYLNQNSSASYSDAATSLLPHSHNYSQSDNGTCGPVGNSVIEDSSFLSRGLIYNDQNVQCHGLSLTLGSPMPSEISEPSFQCQSSYPAMASMLTTAKDFKSDERMFFAFSCASQNVINPEASCHPNFLVNPSEMLSKRLCANSILNSKYLRPVQRLLDEVINVQSSLKQSGSGKNKNLHEMDYGSKDLDRWMHGRSLQPCSDSSVPNRNSSSCELSPAERQDLLDKKTKLMTMLDEVGKKYREYCHQMQIVVSSFVTVAGCGAAEPYTSLAFQTISQHFRCLRDAIGGEIQIIQSNLGEQEGIPRLRYVDQHLRQPRALQQLGVTRQAWRPQRGLPESCVSILRAWLFEHFLHPYPKDSEKIMLAGETGLSRNQVANWFINARVRLWKPMIEDIYKEEFGKSDMSCNLSQQESSPAKNSRDDGPASKDVDKEYHDKLIGAVISKSQDDQMSNTDKNNFCSVENMPSDQIGDINLLTAIGATYDLSELGSLAMNDHVSLALELRNFESGGFRVSSGVNRRVDDNTSLHAETDFLDYHFMDPGKEHHKFANPHLLHEFVV